MLPLTRRIWRRAHTVVTNSADLRRLALKSAPDLPIEVILNGAAATSIGPTAPHTGVRILAVSRLIARKGLDTLIVALGKSGCEQLSLDIAGDGPHRTTLRELAELCGVADRVRFHGFVDRAGIAALHAQADLFVLASRAESCSMALLEAMAAGLPVIATRVGGSVELVEDGVNGLLFKANDVAQLTAALRTLAEHPAQRERFAAANRVLVRERFSWRAVAQRYESIFQQATDQRARSLR
jgi:glycosyltransferase involved in cell wall biosynthesis